MNYSELQDFIKAVAKSGATEVVIDSADLKITIKTPPKGKSTETIIQQVPVQTPVAQNIPAAPVVTPTVQVQEPQSSAPSNDNKETKEDDSKYVTIKSPMVGTFYKKPSPDKPDFVNVGDTVEPGQVVCILEAMKLFNEIESEVSGKIVKVLVEEASPVEFDQPLFLVDPS